MNKNKIYEEFDFLNYKEIEKEDRIKSILKEEYFQKQFIVDSISYMGSKINVNDIDFTMKEKNGKIQIGYSGNITYEYNNDEIDFILNIGKLSLFETIFYTEKRNLIVEGIENKNINWDILPVNIITIDGEVIELQALKNESKEIREEFIKSYLEEFVKNNDLDDNGEELYNSPPLY